MSGIVGISRLDGRPVGRDEIERMNSILAHRGPDGVGAWCDGAIGLGHRMLHTTPESLHEVLPLVDQASGLVVTADARIDNREELISLLDLRDRPSVEIADSRIILAAYEKWGEGCAQRLLGDFAFAIWDGRRRRLFCARDVMGVKPFYYYHGAGTFVFASEIKGILCLEEVPRKLNEVKVADYLVPIFNDQVSSYYEGIVRLPPANSMTLAGGKLELRSYWRLDPSRELQLGGDDEYVEAFRELFIEAVRCRMRSAFAVGSTLSGGLDSSSIACTAGKLRAEGGQPQLHTFSAIFPSMVEEDPRIDERPYIEAVLAKGLFEPHYVRADQCHPLADVAWHKDEVLAAPNLYLTSLLFRSAYEHQVRVLLSGFDGDVTVSYGFEYLEMLAQLGRWATFAQESQTLSQRFGGDPSYYLRCHGIPHLTSLARRLRWWSFGRQAFEISGYFDISGQRLILEAGFKPMFYQPLKNVWCGFQPDNSPASTADVLNGAINPEFARRVGLRERVKTFENEASEFVDFPRQQHIAQLMSGLIQYLGGMFDQGASNFSIEQRYPFFDRRLIEFCVALPFEQKLYKGWTRAILRRAMEGVLPPMVQWRTGKGNVSANIRKRLIQERKTLDSLILRNPDVIAAYVEVPNLRAAYGRFLTHPGRASERDLFTIYLAATLALWLRHSGLDSSKNLAYGQRGN